MFIEFYFTTFQEVINLFKTMLYNIYKSFHRFFLYDQHFVPRVYIEYGQAWRLGQNDSIHYEFIFVEQICSFMQNQLLTKWSLVGKIHENF